MEFYSVLRKFNEKHFIMVSKEILMNSEVDVKVKLALLWASLMSLYIYADYFEMKVPGKIEDVMNQITPVGPTTPKLLVIFSLILIVPALMICLSVFLKPVVNRYLNIGVAVVWSSMSFMILFYDIGNIGGWYAFYVLYQVVEIFVLGAIVWNSWKWPKVKLNEEHVLR